MVPIWRLSGRLGNQMFQFAYLTSLKNLGFIPDVYVQGEEYFKGSEEEIKAMYGQGIVPSDRVSIHVRRTDYVGNAFYADLWALGYYKRAMALFPDSKFLVFSDDIEWCKTQELFKDCEFAEGNTEIEDLNLMAGCAHNIIANSSFSWWAAYINPNPEKIVIAPKEWYADGIERTSLPVLWTRI